MNLSESRSVRIISQTGTPIYVNGNKNQRRASASCSGVVVARQILALWKICDKKTNVPLGNLVKDKKGETVEVENRLTIKVKHAAVLPTDKPFLVNCKGPSFSNMYE